MNQGVIIVARTVGPAVARWIKSKLTVGTIKTAAGMSAVATATTVILIGGREVVLRLKYHLTAEADGSVTRDGSGTKFAAVYDGDDGNEYLTNDGTNFERV